MRTRPSHRLALAAWLGIICALAAGGLALAAETTLTATLAGVTEGANPGDPDGSGSATIRTDPAAGTLCWELTATNINPVTQSHIHIGAAGVSGDVVVPLDVDGFTGTSSGCITSMTDTAPLQAIVANPAGYYVNLHTSDFPAGAIRGQLAAATAPSTALAPSSGSFLALLGLALLTASGVLGARAVRGARSRA